MTSSTRTRYINACRHIAARLTRTADTLEAQPTDCPRAAANNVLVAIELRRLARIVMGDIGKPEEQEEWEIEPLVEPVPEQPMVPA
jgi:hypothetical protein